MRKGLQPLDEKRLRFTGTFVHYGKKNGWKGRTMTTILLKDVHDNNNKPVADHVWFNQTKEFMGLEPFLKEGTVIEFYARVKEYWKGYKGYREDVYDKPVEKDYKLSHPTKIRVLTEGSTTKLEDIWQDMTAGKLTPEDLGRRVKKVIVPSGVQG